MAAPKFDYLTKELQRLENLKSYGILDSPPEISYDQITKLAAAICNVPIALISLVDESRQWFKSRLGVEVPETSREIAFCSHAICDDVIFEVRNALEDERFRNNPLVTGNPNIRFYAGAPLKSQMGFNLGTLCVIDEVPRELTSYQRESLEILASHVVDLLEMRKVNEELRKTQLLLKTQQDLLIHKARMQTVGEMSGGICHQINNPMAIIIGRCMILKTLLENEELEQRIDIEKQVKVIDETANRVSEVVRSLRTIASDEYGDLEIFTLSQVINELLLLSKSSIQVAGVECRLVVESEGRVKSNRKIITQSLLAVITNSLEALSEVEQKILELRVYETTEGVHVHIKDQGPGIHPDHVGKLFEPFFTTKIKNFGMGLALAKKSLQEVGGKLYLKKPRNETTFEIIIPRGKI